MRRMSLTVAAAMVLVSGAAAQEASRRAVAEELLNVMDMKTSIENSFVMMKQSISAQMGKIQQTTGQTDRPVDAPDQAARMMHMMARELSWDKMKDDYISLYAETFTEEEMKGIIAFHKSPAGQAFTKKQPELMRRSLELSQKLLMKIMPKIQAMAKEQQETVPASANR